MKKVLVLIVVGLIVTCSLVCAQAPMPTKLPPRAPMSSHLLTPTAEWNAYYDVVPEGERALYFTVKVMLEALRAQQKQIAELQAQVAALTPKETPDAPDEKRQEDQAGDAKDVRQEKR